MCELFAQWRGVVVDGAVGPEVQFLRRDDDDPGIVEAVSRTVADGVGVERDPMGRMSCSSGGGDVSF